MARETTETQRPSESRPAEPRRAMEWISSLLFWFQLLLAVALYAAVSLAPKLNVMVKLQTEFLKTQSQLVSLENQVSEMQKVVKALESDPRILKQLARLEWDAARPGEERIELSPDLTLQRRITQQREHSPEISRAWYMPLLTTFAENRQLRTTCLSVAAALVLISFTFFLPGELPETEGSPRNLRGLISAIFRRYGSRPASKRVCSR